MKATIIVNPFAGKRKAPGVRRLAERIAADLGVSLTVKTIIGANISGYFEVIHGNEA